ncbi:MAG: hypothetical protein ACREA2_20510 [Blastocatellia bacterium]
MWGEVDRRRVAIAAAAARAAGAVHYTGCATAAAVIHKRERHAQTRDAIYTAATAYASFVRPFSARSSRGPAARSQRGSRQGSGS